MKKISVHVEVEVNPTEDLDRVKKAVENMVSDPEFRLETQNQKIFLIADAQGLESLNNMRILLRNEGILKAAKRMLLRGREGNRITFYLNKQVAYVRHISFSNAMAESPLGPIKMQIESDNSEEIIDWLTPPYHY